MVPSTLPSPSSTQSLMKTEDTSMASIAPSPSSGSMSRSSNSRLFGLFFLIVFSCSIGLFSVASFVQRSGPDFHYGSTTTASSTTTHMKAEMLHLRDGGDLQTVLSANGGVTTPSPTVATPAPAPVVKETVEARWQRLGDLDEYECVGWQQSKDCTPKGEVDLTFFRSCNETIENGQAGYCEIRHKATGKIEPIMEMYCDSLRPAVRFQCGDFKKILSYGRQAPEYTHDASFSYEQCRTSFVADQEAANVPVPAPAITEVALEPTKWFKRGISIVVYERLLESVYASIRSMRALGCTLPIELWYIAEETDRHHPILQKLTQEYGAYLREIQDRRASRFYTKIYAVFYSAFDQVLLLDADNFAVRDPTYLFSTGEFVDTGAIFWPDFWRFKKTIFNIQPTSFVWDVFDLDPVDMFEQESGQVLIDRRRHLAAMNVMMYYAFHAELIEDMRLVWGDKDLFRFAWLKTKSSFHMIQMPPGSAGAKLPDKNVFCGVTMVQHDPSHEIIFLHRNMEKLTSENQRLVWSEVQQFKIDEMPLEEYDVRGANGGRYYPQFKRCYGKDIYYEKAFTVTPISETSFGGLESRLLKFVVEAASIASGSHADASATTGH
ncbi:hypothetical protein Poli38472_004974 [Pythium oligandrum]|uniref:Uncharacterized protein n=1 Tax=Pythium oligandrum TaxID=41045 RepID=A0A8K1CB70_PYTOL|nr:hypothetical protein Poli38472_004974 [Pythium oligandrum]|eukprot:TMW59905.1 hypothetical protein Poli38472_004974 [Pythium oligandrum]